MTCKKINRSVGLLVRLLYRVNYFEVHVAPCLSLSSLRRRLNSWLVPMCYVVFSTSGLCRFAQRSPRETP